MTQKTRRALRLKEKAVALVEPFEQDILDEYDLLEEEMDAIIKARDEQKIKEEVEKIVEDTNKQIKEELERVYLFMLANMGSIVPIFQALGYDYNWFGDGKTCVDRTMINNDELIADLIGLFSTDIDDPVVLLGLALELVEQQKNRWLRLIRTEAEAFYSMGNRDMLLGEGYLYAIISNPSPCAEICEENVGSHIIDLRAGDLGVDLPPYHPNCQCVFEGYSWDDTE